MKDGLPELSRFEMQCLRKLWSLGEASARDVHGSLPDAPSYSTVRTILERLEKKGAVERTRLESRAWIYRSRVSSASMIRREIRRLVDRFFDGRSEDLVAHLAEMDAVTLDDLRAAEESIAKRKNGRGARTPKREAPRRGQARGDTRSGARDARDPREGTR